MVPRRARLLSWVDIWPWVVLTHPSSGRNPWGKTDYAGNVRVLFGTTSNSKITGEVRAIRDLTDGGVDGATRRLASLKGNALGEEGPAGQGGQGFENLGSGGAQAIVAILGFGMQVHGGPHIGALSIPRAMEMLDRWRFNERW